ncbi:serine/threonine-protein kinase MARK2-like [Lagenorhynchus albirostris]|uniref:serine/threonine-protein kinase MARK2-like n=1 Tax=Lagenorhynchus albirostris TaxID=27610 RepID=UPI0028EBCD7C|nr:serine/threonine-protein kinase MARK2-like [Lagenorhynchus albirostris]
MMEGLTASSADKEAHIDDYEILHTIGEGTFAKVKLARHTLTGTQVAVKVIKKRRQSLSTFQEHFREVRNLKALNHPNIVKLLGVIDTEETLFLVMEYLSGGDMFSYLVNHGRMTEAEARGPFQQLVSALQHCHERGIVHRDLKPPNILFDSNMNLKLTDFGFSNKFDDTAKLDTICGTLPYAAPELLLGQSYSGPALDVWSLGVVLYTMVTACRPFVGKDAHELRKRILQGQYPIPPYLSLEIRGLLQKMIALNPSDRGTLPDLMRHPWVNMGQKEPLQPPCEEDPEVTMVRTLGMTRDQVQDPGTGSVSSMKQMVGSSIITVRPLPSRDLSGSEREPSSSSELSSLIIRWLNQGENLQLQEDQQAGQKTSEPAWPPPSLQSTTATPSLQSMTATPSSAHQCGPGTSLSTSSRIGALEGTSCPPGVSNTGRSSHAEQPESMSSSTPSGHSQKKQGVARRIWKFTLKRLCCKLPCEVCYNKVSPSEPLE